MDDSTESESVDEARVRRLRALVVELAGEVPGLPDGHLLREVVEWARGERGINDIDDPDLRDALVGDA
jgi:hypothetical protein